MILNEMSDKAILKEMGLRIARNRLNRNMTQKVLAFESGVSKPTIQRAEAGVSIQVDKLIRILRALNLVKNIESLVPELPSSPLQQIKLKGKARQRAFSKSKDNKQDDWSWEVKQ
ncbi:MAG: helix-turn-helix transcriptional regulator [Candidatus Omnitrophica bacterium]|nr:helix-turn-helix transcriptional regulator [Candidatus Omnitrophota bacterium]